MGSSVYDEEWDTCVVLDGCRHDLYEEVVGETRAEWTPASMSRTWMQETFSESNARDTVYVTANPFAPEMAADLPWREYVELLADEYVEDGTVPAETVFKHAMAARERNPDARLLVHLMQPHWPFVADPIDVETGWADDALSATNTSEWDLAADGVVSDDRVWESYRSNLEYALSSLEPLWEFLDDESLLVTADHGNLVGELGKYGHPARVPHPALRRVPWDVRESGSRTRDEVPDVTPPSRAGDEEVRDRLEDLGYV